MNLGTRRAARLFPCVAPLVVLAALATTARGQTAQDGTAFSSLTVRAGALWQSTDSRFSKFYSPSTGYSAELSMPFYLGEFALAVERATFTGLEPTPHPDFHGTVGMLKWRMPLPSLGPFTAAIGVHAGAMQFSFQDTVVAPGLQKEMEEVFGVNAVGSLRLPAHFSAFVMGEYTHVYIHVPVHIAPLSAGIGYTATTPGWLRDFLR